MKSEKYNALTYPQKGAYVLFLNKFFAPKVNTMVKIITRAIVVGLLGIMLLWIFAMNWYWALLVAFAFITSVFSTYMFMTWLILVNCDKVFEEKGIKNSLFWQSHYFQDTISYFERIKIDSLKIFRALEPIPIPKNRTFFEEFCFMAEIGKNSQNAFYLRVFSKSLQEAEKSYRDALTYLSETKQSLPLTSFNNCG